MITYTDEAWQSLIKPLYNNLPSSAKELSEMYLGYYLWLQDEKEDHVHAHTALRFYWLYQWVHLTRRKPVECFERCYLDWSMDYEPPKLTHRKSSIIPFWLGRYCPKTEGGYNPMKFNPGRGCWTSLSYLRSEVWKALEIAAVECPDLIPQIQREIASLATKGI